jgi:hypothetical protein
MAHFRKGTFKFVEKVWKIVNDQRYNEIIAWNANGKTFCVIDPDKLEHSVLPNHFKHSSFNSFTRQLYFYGFQRMNPKEKSNYNFGNEHFIRDKPDLLTNIKRKGSEKKDSTDIMKELKSLQQKNEFLMNEVAELYGLLDGVMESVEKHVEQKNVNNIRQIKAMRGMIEAKSYKMDYVKRTEEYDSIKNFFADHEGEENDSLITNSSKEIKQIFEEQEKLWASFSSQPKLE